MEILAIGFLLFLFAGLAVTSVVFLYLWVREREISQLAEERAKLVAEEWLKGEEQRIRADAISRSTAVVSGKVAEQYALYGTGFNPRDARFLGSPVDFVIFDGLTEGDLERVVFLEVKTGKTGRLSPRERMVREVIEDAEVDYEVYHIGGDEDVSS